MQRALYQLLLVLALPFIPFRLLWRGLRQPAYLRHVGERFGWYDGQGTQPLVWVHAVSVGEVRAALPLLAAMKSAWPQAQFLLTVMTPTGRETAQSLLDERTRVAYLPYDFGATVERFLDHFRPRIGIVMETELWPNLIAACHARKLPVALVNARLSEQSARGYARFSELSHSMLQQLSLVAAQSSADATRLQALGARGVRITGNMKFDLTPDAALVERGQSWRAGLGTGRQVILLASSRDGEEAVVLERWQRLPANIRNDRLLVIVPRHPQRFDAVWSALQASGLPAARRSAESTGALRDCELWLGDSMGEMAAYFALADIVIMGGSLGNFGSQNLIEPCAQGKPVVLGPSVFNFQEAARLAVEAGAARQVAEGGQTLACALDWLGQSEEMQRAAEAALQFTATHRGATARTLAALQSIAGGRL